MARDSMVQLTAWNPPAWLGYSSVKKDEAEETPLASGDAYELGGGAEDNEELLRAESAHHSSRSRRRLLPLLLVILTAVTALVALGYLFSQQRSNTGSNGGAQYLSITADHLGNHPDMDSSALSFAQMGLRARLYAQVLQDGSLSDEELDRIEKKLWPFVPKIKAVRVASQARQRSTTPNRGIILTANKDMFAFACHFMATLRNIHKSSLPVEIYHYGEAEMPLAAREHLATKYDARLVDLEQSDTFDQAFAGLKDGRWAMKVHAILASNFTEVFMADADTVFLAPPESFFEQEGYRKHGTLFFRDRLTEHRSDRGHDFLKGQLSDGKPSVYMDGEPFWTDYLLHRQESGVVLLNRSKPQVLAALLFIVWQNAAPIRGFSYDIYHGDKETFWIAFEIAGFPYYMAHHNVGVIGAEHTKAKHGEFCGEHPLHFFDSQHRGEGITDPADRNRTLGLPAWFNGSLRNDKYHGDGGDLMDLPNTIWAMDGRWIWHDNPMGFCLIDFTKQSTSEYGLDTLLSRIVQSGRDAEAAAKLVPL